MKSNFFKLDKDIFLCCAYIPSTNSKYFNDGEDKVLDLLKQDIEKYSNLGNIIVFGDLNCRLGEKQEELIFIDSDCEDQNYLNTIEIPNRISQDKKSNTSGNMLSEIMNANTLLTLNRRKTGDTLAKFTCHEHNGSSTVDTAITSWEIYDKVQYFKVLDPVWFSDHCPIQFSVETDQYIFEEEIDMSKFQKLDQCFHWTPEGQKQFSQMLESSKIQDRFQKEIIDSIPQNNNPTLVTEKIEKIFLDIARESLTPKKNVTMKQGQKPYCNKWMDETCFKAKRDFLKEKKEVLKFPRDMGWRLIFMNVKKRCKKMHYLTERAFRERNLHKVAQLCDRDPKSFWSSVEELWEGYCPKLELVRRLGKKKDTDRPILIKFVHSHDKHKLLYETKDVLNGLKVKDDYKNEGCQEIEQMQDSFLKYCINVSKHCSNVISRAELGKFPLPFKVQALMVKYFLRIAQGTGNKVLDEAYASSQEIDSTWIQNVERFLKSNGFANVFLTLAR